MITFKELQQIALSFPETTEEPHFEKTSFRVKKKIFATCDQTKNRATLKLSVTDQDLFSLQNKEAVYPVPNKWGAQGWTQVDLDQVHPEILKDALRAAFVEVAPKYLGDQFLENIKGEKGSSKR